MSRFRDGMPVTSNAVTLVLSAIDRIKIILAEIEEKQGEEGGDDSDLLEQLHHLAEHGRARTTSASEVLNDAKAQPSLRGPPEVKDLAREKAAAERSRDERERAANYSIRVQVETLDNLMTRVSELVLTRNQLLEIVRRHEESDFNVPLQRLSNVTAELQEGVMKTRMQPIGNAWQKLPRIVRDLCTELEKDIELEMHGANTELDRQVLELVKDPLTHLVRNCADHGIESPAERLAAVKPRSGEIRLSGGHQGGHLISEIADKGRAAGKPRSGKIRVFACHQGCSIIIEIADNGRGLDIERIRALALEHGLLSESELAAKSDSEICNLIFTPGFSTATRITSISGRGIGMDVVRANVEQIGGTVELKSIPKVGTTFSIKIPLTLAIVSALIVEASGERFAIPQLSVLELVRAGGAHRIEWIKETPVLRLRRELLPLIYLNDILRLDQSKPDHGFVVVMQVGNQIFCLVVDGFFHTEEIVIKPMSSKLRYISAFSGTTILGDGAVIMIIDPNGIVQALGRASPVLARAQEAETRNAAESSNQILTPLLVFRAGSQQPKAVPLSLISRLEEIDCGRIEKSNDQHLVQYRGQLMPLLCIDAQTMIKRDGVQPVLVFSERNRSMGLLVDEIVDIVEQQLDIEVVSDQPGVLGCAVVKGRATEVIDVGHFLPRAFADWLDRRDARPAPLAPKVLLVDDSAFFRDMLAPLIKAAGYQVVPVASGTQALAAISSGTAIDVVVTDIEMPEMDGFALATTLRQDPRTAAIPVIALSAMVSTDAIQRGRRAGFHDFVAKFDRAGLIAAIKEQTDELHAAA